MKLIENLKTLEVKKQIEMLKDFAIDAKTDGRWHDAHALDTRITELEAENADIAGEIKTEAESARKKAKKTTLNHCKDGFIALGLD